MYYQQQNDYVYVLKMTRFNLSTTAVQQEAFVKFADD